MAKAVITEVTIWNEAYEARYYSGATKSGNTNEMPKTVKTWMEKNPEKVNDYRTEPAEEPEAKNLVDLVLELEALKSKPALTDEEIKQKAEAIKPDLDTSAIVDNIVSEIFGTTEPETTEAEQEPEQEPETMEQEQAEEPKEVENLPVLAEAGTVAAVKEPIAFEGYGAAEVVMFGVCMTFAFIWWITRGIVEIILATLSMLVYRLWTDREQIAEGIKKTAAAAAEYTARICRRTATAIHNIVYNLPTVRSIKTISVIARLIIVIVGLAIMAI